MRRSNAWGVVVVLNGDVMRRVLWPLVVGLLMAGCSIKAGPDPEAALFASLFDVPRGTCRELRAQLHAEMEGIRAAKKKAHDDLLAEAEAPAADAKPPRPLRKEDQLAPLREWSKRSEQAEKLNVALKERRCRTVDIEAAVK